MKIAPVLCLVSLLTLSTAHATTWTSLEPETDPVRTDPDGIRFCPKSGFTAFIGDFELTPKEKAAVTTEPATFYKPISQPSLSDKLVLLEKSYAARNPNARDKVSLLRVLAYYHETDLKDFDGAAAFRRKALDMIEAALATDLPTADRMEYLFVSAVYHREFGDLEKSNARAKLLEQALQQYQGEELAGYVEYLTGLSKEIDKIAPGGRLVPGEP